MLRSQFRIFTIAIFLLTGGAIGALVFIPGDIFSSKSQETQRTRFIIPQGTDFGENGFLRSTRGDELQSLKVELQEGEAAVAVLNRDFKGYSFDDQIVAYRILQDIDSPIFITYLEFDEQTGQNHRVWNASTAATRPGTLIIYTEDLIGDGGICVLVSGMNNSGEQTLTVFRKNPSLTDPFIKIAELGIEGSIAVEELDSRGRVPGRSLSISTFGRDYSSPNIMDQIETVYTFNPNSSLYEQSRMLRIPGAQIEQRRIGELLNGQPDRFEEFIRGLWYQGDENERRYVYFNTETRELVFYNNNVQEIFLWQNSSSTRYGIHIGCRNMSLTNVRRTINVELVSLENIRLRIFQDAYLRTAPITIWDGLYQRLPPLETVGQNRNVFPRSGAHFIDESFTSHDAILAFNSDGFYNLDPISGPSELSRRGLYVFFTLGGEDLLELRTIEQENGTNNGFSREVFKVKRDEEFLVLNRVQIGIRGIQDLHELPIVLNKK